MPNTTYHLHLKGFVGGWEFDSDYTQYILDKYPDQEVRVCIDSMGGSLAKALTISAAFKAHGKVHVHYVAMNASAATIASLGATKVSIDRDGWYLVHKTSFQIDVLKDMNEQNISDYIKNLEAAKAQLAKYDLQIAKAYARRCKKDPADLYALMEKETFLSAEEALEWGFVDEITDNPEDAAPVLDEITLNYCNQSGIAIPQALMKFRPQKQDHDQKFLDRIVATIKSAFTPNNTKMNKDPKPQDSPKADSAKAEAAGEKEVAIPKAPSKNSAKAEAAGEPEAGSQTDRAENNEISALKAEIENLKKENADMREKLDAKPADAHNQVIDSKKPSTADNLIRTNLTKSARDLFNSIS